MKRNAKKNHAKRQAAANAKAQAAGKPATPQAEAPAPGRRGFMKIAGTIGLATVVVGAGGWFFVDDVMSTQLEHDLSRIGNGMPAIVQIHDPQCPKCTALQREARTALSELDNPDLQYVVANIRSREGKAYADRHGVAHVTLLLLDGSGKVRNTLTGPHSSAALLQAFSRHMQRFGGASG